MDVATALSRGIIDQANGLYIESVQNGQTVEMPISVAIKRGLVIADESSSLNQPHPDAPTHGRQYIQETKTFSVIGVRDSVTGAEMSVADAIKKGYLDQNKGLYMDLSSGESMSIPEAVERGLVQADISSVMEKSKRLSATSQIITSADVSC